MPPSLEIEMMVIGKAAGALWVFLFWLLLIYLENIDAFPWLYGSNPVIDYFRKSARQNF